jgi:hypothetical protein
MNKKLKWHHRFLREVVCSLKGHDWKENPNHVPIGHWHHHDYDGHYLFCWLYKCKRCRVRIYDAEPTPYIRQQLWRGLKAAFSVGEIKWTYNDAIKYGKYNSRILACVVVLCSVLSDFAMYQEWMYPSIQELFYELEYQVSRRIFKE